MIALTDEGRRVILQAMAAHAEATRADYYDCEDDRAAPLLAAAHLAAEHAAIFADLLGADLRRGVVGLDGDGPVYPALIMREKWNGAACPLFDDATVQQLARDPRLLAEGFSIEKRGRVWVVECGGEVDAYEPQEIDGVDRWAIGAFRWCWIEIDESEGK